MDGGTVPYDRIGIDYSNLRKADQRIARMICDALGDARSVLNVGAGTGSYEPSGLDLTAIEPSSKMIAQRSADAAPAIQGCAENLPFADNQFDASMAILTVHHWSDQAKGLREMRRVTRRRIIIFTFDPGHGGSWLTDYLPALSKLDEAQMPSLDFYAEHLGKVHIAPVPVPRDCTDGFLYAYWARPHAYLDERIRQGSSSFWALADLATGLAKLEADLATGEWARRYADIADRDSLDCGYRLVVADEL